jgi:hypothetical protein
MEVTQTILETMENNMLKWHGHAVHMEDNSWLKHKMTWSLGERQQERSKVKWEKEVARVMKQKNLTSDNAIYQLLLPLRSVTGGPMENS